MEALTLDRIQFAFTITYHYLFPQLTMGLAPLIVVFKTLAIWKKEERWNEAARFWAKIFGITRSGLFGTGMRFGSLPPAEHSISHFQPYTQLAFAVFTFR